MSSSLKIIDKPYYPLDPEKSKKTLKKSQLNPVGATVPKGGPRRLVKKCSNVGKTSFKVPLKEQTKLSYCTRK